MKIFNFCFPTNNQPILNYLILYGMPNDRAGAAKAMKYVIEQGADVNGGAPNGVGEVILYWLRSKLITAYRVTHQVS